MGGEHEVGVDPRDPDRPLTDYEQKSAAKLGLSEADGKRWRNAGFTPIWTEQFLALGLTPDEAALADAAGFSPVATKKVLDRGVTLADLERWSFVGRHPADKVLWCLDRGLAPEVARDVFRNLDALTRKGVDGAVARDWFDLGWDLDAIVEAVDDHHPVESIATDYPIIVRVRELDLRDQWRAAAKFVKKVAPAIDAGLTPVEAVWGRKVHDPEFEPPVLVVDQDRPYLSCEDGSPLPPALARRAARPISIGSIRAVGFAARQRNSAEEFRVEFHDAIVADVRFAEPAPDRVSPIVRVVPGTDDGWRVEWLVIGGENLVDAESSTLDDAVAHLAAALRGDFAGEIVRIGSRARADEEVLALTVDADLPMASLSRVNRREVHCQIQDGRSLVVPAVPMSWDRYVVLDDGCFLIGDLVFVDQGSAGVRYLGHRDAIDLDCEVASAWKDVPALAISRIERSGTRDHTEVWRTSPTTFVVRTDDGRETVHRADTVCSLVELVPALAEVRRDSLTEITSSANEAVALHELTARLRPVGERIDLEELIGDVDGLPDDVGVVLPVWAEDFWEGCRFQNAGYFPAFVDGNWVIEWEAVEPEHWFLVPAESPADTGAIVPIETWGSISLCEEASMVSGVDRYSLELVSPDTVAEVSALDERGVWIELRTARGDRRLAEIVRWLGDLSGEVGLDLSMLAVENLIGEGAGYASEFTDGASASCSAYLWVDVDFDEIEGFLDCLRDAGEEDCVRAIREPESEPGQRRRARLRPECDD